MTPPAAPPPVGPAPPPPYGPYPPPYPPAYPPPYAPPPKKDNTILIIVVILVVVVVAAAAIAAWFFFILSPVINMTPSRPVVYLSTASVSGGNATLTVGVAYPEEPYSDFKLNLTVNGTSGTGVQMAGSGVAVVVTVGSSAYNIIWTDNDGRGTLSTGDTFRISALYGLPAGTSFTFRLSWGADSATITTRAFTT